jgi:acetyltransferase EpsM
MAAIDPASQATAQPDAVKSPGDLVILGAGEHASVVAEAATASGWLVQGFVAPDDIRTSGLGELRHLGDDPTFAAGLAGMLPAARPALVIAFGGPAATASRRRAADQYLDARWATVIHPTAWVSPSARLDPGVVVLAGATVNGSATIGRHAIVNSGSIIEHDVVIGDFVQVSPGAILGGGAKLGDDTFVGLGAIIRDHTVVGPGSVVGMGAVVVADVSEGAVVTGSPAGPMDRSRRTD